MRRPFTEADFMQAYSQTVDALYVYASCRCGGDRELAEDVTQEVWLRAMKEWSRKGIPEKALGWLMAVARNLIVDEFRRRPLPTLDLAAAASMIAAVDEGEATESAQIASAVTHALGKIPKAEADLLEAFHFEHSKVAQIAEAHGVSERAIEGRLRRARERLRHELEITLTAKRALA